MTRRCWAVVAFGLGVALAPLAQQLGTVCLRPAVAVAQEGAAASVLRPVSDAPDPFQNPLEIPQQTATGQIKAPTLDLAPNVLNDLDSAPPPELSSLPPAPNSAEVFLELSKQKAALLTPEEMAREVESLQKELTELRATAQLREAVGKLKQLVGEHPQTAAAQRAAKMLEAETAPSPGANRRPVSEEDLLDPPTRSNSLRRVTPPVSEVEDQFNSPEPPTRNALPTR